MVKQVFQGEEIFFTLKNYVGNTVVRVSST